MDRSFSRAEIRVVVNFELGLRPKTMAAGVTDRQWEVSDLVAMLEASEQELERAA